VVFVLRKTTKIPAMFAVRRTPSRKWRPIRAGLKYKE